jgi:hypothetical protein
MSPVNVPVPEPFGKVEFEVVGFTEVPQHIPRAVTVALPSNVTLPPDDADEVVIAEMSAVDTVGTTVAAFVVN